MKLPFELNLGLLFGALVVIVMIVVIYFSIQSSRKYTQQRQSEALELGFCPTERSGYPYLLKKIAFVNPRYGKSGMQVRHVFQRQLPEGMIYQFDLWDTGGEDSTELLSYAFLLVRQGPDLPAFMISTLPDTTQLPAMVMGLMQKFNQWMLDRSLPRVVFPPEYAAYDRVQVVSDDPARMLELLDQSILARISASQGMSMAGKGDSILYSEMKMPGNTNQTEKPTLARRYNLALDAFRSITQHAA